MAHAREIIKTKRGTADVMFLMDGKTVVASARHTGNWGAEWQVTIKDETGSRSTAWAPNEEAARATMLDTAYTPTK